MMQHQSDRDMPRCNFHGGFHGCFPKITGNETVGVMLVACLVMATDAGIKLCKDKVGMSMGFRVCFRLLLDSICNLLQMPMPFPSKLLGPP